MPNNLTNLIYTLPEVQKILRIGQTALYGRIARGEIQARHLGGRTVVYRAELDRYIKAAPVVAYGVPSAARS